ncbi:MAG: hypothetical protein ABI859_15995 [Pseudomonadota bacterium]
MKSAKAIVVVAVVAALAGCGGSGNDSMGGGTTTPPVGTTPTPTPNVFANFVVEQVLGNGASSDTSLPIEVETTTFASLDDDDPTRFDGVFTSTP